jgi:hypothetical protein
MSKNTLKELDPSDVPSRFPFFVNALTEVDRQGQRHHLENQIRCASTLANYLGLQTNSDNYLRIISLLDDEGFADRQATLEIRKKL